MKRSIYKICFITAILLFAVTRVFADDDHSKSIIITSKARVITPISLENTGNQGLDFGVIALGTLESKVVVSADEPAHVTVSGGAVVITSTLQKAATFTVSGQDGQAYLITLPPSATLTSGTSSQILTVNPFSCSKGLGSTIGTGADNLFYVGGELTIPAGATPAVYNGTFNVTVAYY